MTPRPIVSVYIATSLDGFIAREDGDIGWLTAPERELAGEDYGYRAFMDSVDVLVMGRGTYEKVLTLGEWFYGDKRVIVLSTANPSIPEALADRVSVYAGSPSEVVTYLAEQGVRHVYLDGGKTVQGFLRDNLVDEVIITWIPILIGRGLPLFGELTQDIELQHEQTQTYPNGFVQSRYRIKSAR